MRLTTLIKRLGGRTGRLFSPVILLGVMVKIQNPICPVSQSAADNANSDLEQSACSQPDNSSPIHPSLSSSVTLYRSRRRTPHRKNQALRRGDTCRSPHQQCSHLENGEVASWRRSQSEDSKSSDVASITAELKQSKLKRRMLIGLGASVYLPVLPLWWISKTQPPPPRCLLLATQG